MHTQACTLKHRPAVLPQDAVFQLFKPQLKLAAQPLEGKAGRIPVITVWLVEWLQLASLSLEDLHTYKKAQGSKVQLQEIFLYYSDTSQEVKKGLMYVWKFSKSQRISPKILSVYTTNVSSQSKLCKAWNGHHSLKRVWWNLFAPYTVSACFHPSSNRGASQQWSTLITAHLTGV